MCDATRSPVAVVVCGPCGVGKSTIGAALAEALGCLFAEGDKFHSAANIAKMAAGTPLDDADRAPWLARLRSEVIVHYVRGQQCSVVLACSALKRCYRDALRGVGETGATGEPLDVPVFFVQLTGDPALIARRMSARAGHFMPPSLLASQLETLEPLEAATETGMTLDLAETPEEIVRQVVRRLSEEDPSVTSA